MAALARGNRREAEGASVPARRGAESRTSAANDLGACAKLVDDMREVWKASPTNAFQTYEALVAGSDPTWSATQFSVGKMVYVP
jgi:hypothetical protein